MLKLEAKDVSVWYGETQAVKHINVAIPRNSVIAFIGPSGCGKSTFLRTFNRMNDLIENCRVTGTVLLDGVDTYGPEINPVELRKKVGMVFQKPNPFPKSIYENVAYGLRINGVKSKTTLDDAVEKALHQAALWEEVKHDLKKSAYELSGGQQQRLCIARTLAVEPSVVLMDEPTSALDPISTAKIEQLIDELRQQYTILIVTHNMQQASRVSDKTAFFHFGELVEFGETRQIFTHPKDERTLNYITGRFG